MKEKSTIRCKRVYEPATDDDGYRVLVDRLWPRGMRKEALAFDEWLKAVAPSDALRKQFGHDPARFAQFRDAYRAELLARSENWQPLLAKTRHGPVTLLYAARDEKHNQAVVLAEFLSERAAAP